MVAFQLARKVAAGQFTALAKLDLAEKRIGADRPWLLEISRPLSGEIHPCKNVPLDEIRRGAVGRHIGFARICSPTSLI